MKVTVKDFAVSMALGTNGITFDVYETDNTHRGDIRFGKATIEWCPRRVRVGNGYKVSWNDFISWMEANGKKK